MAKVLNSTRGAVAGILLVFALLAAACGGDEGGSTAEADSGPGDEADLAGTNDDDEAAGSTDDTPVENDNADDSGSGDSGSGDGGSDADPDEPTEPEYPIEFGTGLPAGGTWGVLEITMERLFLDLIDPGSLISTNRRPSETPNIFAEVTIENTHELRPQSVRATQFALRLSDGTEIRASEIGSDLRSLSALLAKRDLVGFEPLDPVTSLDGAELLVGIDEVRFSIAEDGTVVGDPDPVPFPLTGSGESVGQDIGGCTQNLSTTITGGRLQINSDVTFFDDVREADLNGTRRAGDGTVYLVVDYDVTNNGGSIICGGSANPPMVRLLVDGTPWGPDWQPAWQNPAGTTTPSSAGWQVTPDATTLELVFGEDQTWSVELDPAVVFAELPT